MQLGINSDGLNELRKIILDHYQKNGGKTVSIFKETLDASSIAIHYLLERKHVIQYAIGLDDKGWKMSMGTILLGIGPHYFSPADFWSYENFRRFKMAAEPFDIQFNLKLLDEFLALSNQGR